MKLAKAITCYMALLIALCFATSVRAQSGEPHFFSHHKVHFFSHHKAHFFPHQGPPPTTYEDHRRVYYHRSQYNDAAYQAQDQDNDKPHFFSHHKVHFFSHHKAHFFPHEGSSPP